MELKDTQIVQYTEKRLLQNEFYFKYIFKKTEKIAYAVLYSIRHSAAKDTNDPIVHQLESAALSLIDSAVASLTIPEVGRGGVLYTLIERYFALESKIKIAEAAGIMSSDIAAVFLAEIEAVYRSIERFRTESRQTVSEGGLQPVLSAVPRNRRTQSSVRTRDAAADTSGSREEQKSGRRDRIKSIIKDRGEVSIKDISDIITDVSEKTIQRELNDMIDEGQIVRHGEKRWSRYSVAE